MTEPATVSVPYSQDEILYFNRSQTTHHLDDYPLVRRFARIGEIAEGPRSNPWSSAQRPDFDHGSHSSEAQGQDSLYHGARG